MIFRKLIVSVAVVGGLVFASGLLANLSLPSL